MVQRGEHCGLLVFFVGGFIGGVDGGFVGWIWWWCVSGAIVVATMGLLSW